jgi:hypothetical protein
LVINLGKRQHRKRRITKREGDKAMKMKETMIERRKEVE